MRTEVSSLLDKFDNNGDGKLNYAQVYKFIKKIVKDRNWRIDRIHIEWKHLRQREYAHERINIKRVIPEAIKANVITSSLSLWI